MTEDLKLNEIPFYWRVKKNSDDFSNDIPIKLPFSFAFDNKNQLLIQKRNKKTIDYLNKIYLANSNVGYLQEGHSLATSYGDEFLNFVYENTSKWDYKNRSAIDV